jgi:hypothetical protein
LQVACDQGTQQSYQDFMLLNVAAVSEDLRSPPRRTTDPGRHRHTVTFYYHGTPLALIARRDSCRRAPGGFTKPKEFAPHQSGAKPASTFAGHALGSLPDLAPDWQDFPQMNINANEHQ